MQYAGSKVDYVIRELIYMLPSDMNLRIGKIKNYNNKILVSSSSFNMGTNLKINLDDNKHLDKDKPDVKPNKPDIKSIKEQKQDIKIIRTKPDPESNKEHKLDIKMMKTEPDMNKITYEEEKVALILGMTSIFQSGDYSNNLFSSRFGHEICVYQDSYTCYESPQILR